MLMRHEEDEKVRQDGREGMVTDFGDKSWQR